MSLTPENMQKIAELAKLHIPTDQLPALTERMENILKLMQKMDRVDTQNITPLSHAFTTAQPLREDIISEKNQRDLLQQNAPCVEAGLYIVPKFVDNE